jgi:hypothetical protein
MIEKGIVSRGPKRRDEMSYRVERDIVIPAGTILRHRAGSQGTFEAAVGFGPEFAGNFVVERNDLAAEASGYFKKVVAA